MMDEYFLKPEKQLEHNKKVEEKVSRVLDRRQGYEQVSVEIIYEEVRRELLPY
jgi:hypothetical protein